MLDKAIRHGKEHRKPYYGAGKYDKTCRPHGGCPWCERNRTFFDSKRRVAAALDALEIDEEDVQIMTNAWKNF